MENFTLCHIVSQLIILDRLIQLMFSSGPKASIDEDLELNSPRSFSGLVDHVTFLLRYISLFTIFERETYRFLLKLLILCKNKI